MVGASWSACPQDSNSHLAGYKPACRYRAHESAVGPKLNSENLRLDVRFPGGDRTRLAVALTSEYDHEQN
jgi:hypothetical protein